MSTRPKGPDDRGSVTRPTRPSGNLRQPATIDGAAPSTRDPEDAFIVVIYGTELGRRVSLPRGGFEIGRSSSSDLVLDEDAVSRHHARIMFQPGEGYVVMDQRSTNGVWVNDMKVKEAILTDGDQIKVGRTIMKFMTGANIEANYHDEVYRLMTVDGLTQAYNKRYFEEALERECNRAKRHTRPLSLVMFDVDHFKQKNDMFGHLAGDSILRQIAAAVAAKLRREDIFARVGGEEFAVLLPEIGPSGAKVTAEKVRRIVESLPIDLQGETVSCTVSVGFATFDASAPQPYTIVKAADVALYKAKTSGRNRVMG